jgi:phosphoribosylanthranilate isomerase
VLDQVPLDVLQLYGSAAVCREIHTRFALPVWRAIGVAEPAELPAHAEGLDGFVIEAKAPLGAARPGGNATALDWGLLAGWIAPGFWLLAGGLRPENVARAIQQTAAPAVDVSSGVETAPGEKSPALIRNFIASVRNAGLTG